MQGAGDHHDDIAARSGEYNPETEFVPDIAGDQRDCADAGLSVAR